LASAQKISNQILPTFAIIVNSASLSMYHHAILRKPGPNFAQGITTADLGKPDYTLALHQHSKYAEALKKSGLALTVLEADHCTRMGAL
jgi:hypothetical protein